MLSGPPVASLHPQSCSFFESIIQLFRVFPFDAFFLRLAEGVPISIHQRITPPPFCNVVDIDARLPSARSSAPSVNSSGLYLTGIRVPFFSFRPSYLTDLKPSPQLSYFKGTMIVNLCEVSQTLCEALAAHLTEVRHDVLYEAVSIVLLVRQATSTH